MSKKSSNFAAQNCLNMKRFSLLFVSLLTLLCFTSCGNSRAQEEGEKFVRDSIADVERVAKEKLEKELWGDVRLGMSKEEILNTQFFDNSAITFDDNLFFILENKKGYEMNVDSLQLKFTKARLWYSPSLSEFFIQSEYTQDFKTLERDVKRMTRFLCEKYGEKYDKYSYKVISKSNFIRNEHEYPYFDYKYGHKRIELKLKGEDLTKNYSYVIIMKEAY